MTTGHAPEPLTDEELDRVRYLNPCDPKARDEAWPGLLRSLDAERARAEQAEERLAAAEAVIEAAKRVADTWAWNAVELLYKSLVRSELESRLAAAEAVIEAAKAVCVGPPDDWAIERLGAALDAWEEKE